MALRFYRLKFVISIISSIYPLHSQGNVHSVKLMEILNDYYLHQGFPNWGTCAPRGTFRLLKGYIIM